MCDDMLEAEPLYSERPKTVLLQSGHNIELQPRSVLLFIVRWNPWHLSNSPANGSGPVEKEFFGDESAVVREFGKYGIQVHKTDSETEEDLRFLTLEVRGWRERAGKVGGRAISKPGR